MDLALAGKRVLVSGASRGIGRAIAEAFANEGAQVAAIARGESDLKTLAASHAAIHPIVADMTDEASARSAWESADKHIGAIDICIANLGGGSPAAPASQHSEWQRVINLNLFSASTLAIIAGERLTNNGALVFVSSIAGLEALGAPAPYAVAKAGLQALVKTTARSLGPAVRVNAIAPGNVLFEGSTWDRKLREDSAGVETILNSDVPLRRLGTPEEIADAVLFLASARAAFITGATLVVDGGQTRAF